MATSKIQTIGVIANGWDVNGGVASGPARAGAAQCLTGALR
ncbi:MAG: hypothetical protein QOC94_3765 [Actinoplanes sp.]|nr:hypothetical protein [Actinoplanes sp.]